MGLSPFFISCSFEDCDISQNKVIQDVKKNSTGHLSQSHLDYFLKWSILLNMEAEQNKGMKSIQQIYTLPPEKRLTLFIDILYLKYNF